MTWPDELIELYEASYQPHVRLAYTMLGSVAEAEEIVQDAFMSTWRRWEDVRSPTSYLRRTVVNGAIGVLRRREIADRLTVDPAPTGEPERLIELRDSLLQLPYRQRVAIVLRFIADETTAEIAGDLGCREATVRSLISRGLATLRRKVQP